MYLLKLSIRPWRRSLYSQLFTSAAVGVLLFLGAFLFWLHEGLGPVVDRLRNEQVITAYLDPNLDAAAETAVVDQIRTSLGAHAQAEIELIQSERFLEHLKSNYPELARELEDLGSEVQTVVPRYVSISGLLPANGLGEIRQLKGVLSTESSTDRFQNVIGAFQALKWLAGLLSLGLALALMTGLIHLGRINSILQQDSSSLMKLMGASPAALRTPGIVSSALVGLLGGVLAASGWLGLALPITRHVRSLSPMLKYLGTNQPSYAVGLLVLGIFLGGLSGLMGHWMCGHSSSAQSSSSQRSRG